MNKRYKRLQCDRCKTTECIKKTEQIGNRSQICKAAVGMKFLPQVHYFGTYDVD